MEVYKIIPIILLYVFKLTSHSNYEYTELSLYPDKIDFGPCITSIPFGHVVSTEYMKNTCTTHGHRKSVFSTSYSHSKWLNVMLLLSGDVHPCPGPDSSSPVNNSQYDVFRKRGLHLLHVNVRSLLPKLHEIRMIASQTNAACIGITESWLDNSVFDSELSIPNYTIVRRDRNRQGGGVCIFIRCDLAFYSSRSST